MSKVKNPKIIRKARLVLEQKLGLEKEMIKDLMIYFNICSGMVSRGKALPSSKDVITRNAHRIVDVLFKGHNDRVLLKQKVDNGNERLIKLHYKSIDNTNNEKYELAISQARDMLNEPELKAQSTITSINKTAANIFQQSSNNRIDNIAITEVTQLHNQSRRNIFIYSIPDYNEAIENEDDDEADDLTDFTDTVAMDQANKQKMKLAVVIINVDDTLSVGPTVKPEEEEITEPEEMPEQTRKKQWISMGDDKVCDMCDYLDGQMVFWEEPFEFEGEDIWSPNDTHGACRCDVYF